MSISASYVGFTEWIVSCLGNTHVLAHVHAGLVIYVVVQVITRDRRASTLGLICVAGAEFANEIIEAAHYGSMRWGDTLGDVAMTLFWPVVLHSVSRYRRRRWERTTIAHLAARQMLVGSADQRRHRFLASVDGSDLHGGASGRSA
jgi:hypothetical protein